MSADLSDYELFCSAHGVRSLDLPPLEPVVGERYHVPVAYSGVTATLEVRQIPLGELRGKRFKFVKHAFVVVNVVTVGDKITQALLRNMYDRFFLSTDTVPRDWVPVVNSFEVDHA